MSARDELAREVWLADRMRAAAPGGPSIADRTVADRLIAAGYRKPRTITTTEELDALPDGSIVMADWATHQRILGQWATFGSPATSQPELPATVLHEPEAEATR